MKETKVYVDGEFPQVYFDPKTGNECIEGRPLILEDIKIHDRELVAKVLDKVKFLITKYDLLKNYNSCAGSFMLDKIIDQIQKEYEK